MDAVRAWKYPYNQWCRALRDPARPASARSGYIYQAKPDYVTFDPFRPGSLLTGLLWARNRWKPMFESCTCSTFNRGINGTIQNSSKHRADSQCMPYDFRRVFTSFALTEPVDCPRASCDLGIKYLMLRSHA